MVVPKYKIYVGNIGYNGCYTLSIFTNYKC